MPVKVYKVRGRKCYRVTHNGKTSAKCTSKSKAMRQKRLLYGVKHGMKPRGRKFRR